MRVGAAQLKTYSQWLEMHSYDVLKMFLRKKTARKVEILIKKSFSTKVVIRSDPDP